MADVETQQNVQTDGKSTEPCLKVSTKTVEGSIKGVRFTLAEEAPDRRLPRSIFEFTVENKSQGRIAISKLSPVDYEELHVVVDPNSPALEPRRRSLAIREQLSELFFRIKPFTPDMPQVSFQSRLGDFVEATLGALTARSIIRKMLIGLFSGQLNRRIDKYLNTHGALPMVENYEEARKEYETLDATAVAPDIKGNIETLLTSLQTVEERIRQSEKLIVVDKDTIYKASYVAIFERAWLNERPHTFSLKCDYTCLSDACASNVSTASYSANIALSTPTSPYPLPLTVTAMFFSCLGAWLNQIRDNGITARLPEALDKAVASLDQTSDMVTRFGAAIPPLKNALEGLKIAAAPLAAVVDKIKSVLDTFGGGVSPLNDQLARLKSSLGELKPAISQQADNPALQTALDQVSQAITNLANVLPHSQLWLIGMGKAVLVACVLFNVYERTPLWTKINLGLNWRGAMVVGVTAGLLADKIIDWFLRLVTF